MQVKIEKQKTWSFPLNEKEKLEVKQIAMNLPADERAIVYLKYWLGMLVKYFYSQIIQITFINNFCRINFSHSNAYKPEAHP